MIIIIIIIIITQFIVNKFPSNIVMVHIKYYYSLLKVYVAFSEAVIWNLKTVKTIYTSTSYNLGIENF